MDTSNNMILIKGEIKTSEIESCQFNNDTKKWDVKFNNNKIYSYGYSNVEKLSDPKILNPDKYHIKREGRELFGVSAIYVFSGKNASYCHICFADGGERDYLRDDLNIVKTCLDQDCAAEVFSYIKRIAGLSEIRNEETGEKLLEKRFEKLTFVGDDVALAKYLNPASSPVVNDECIPIFPFGCNNSQYKAVKNAMENQVSVIQGPPGTGKTQTILNIIANILIQGKTVQIVSNNNAATDNVYDKLSSSKYDLGFIAAKLGNSENKRTFIEKQNPDYPVFSTWETRENQEDLLTKISEESIQLKSIFDKQERLARLNQEYSWVTTEQEYFKQHIDKADVDIEGIRLNKNNSSDKWMTFWQDCQFVLETKKEMGLFFKIRALLKYGITDWNIYDQDIAKMITMVQTMYYHAKIIELSKEIADIERYLNNSDKNLLTGLCDQSMAFLKDKLAKKYGSRDKRKIFSEDDLWLKPWEVLEEYPVILSTTFSSKSSLNTNVIYDYLIIDEASQVDIATGALALSCAKNVVIVGDTKQLPNVVTEDVKARARAIYEDFDIHEGYEYTKSFLQSVLEVMPNVPQTLLREHYRCHPKIINFCNQKFYQGELIIMTQDNGEEDVLSVIKTVVGNHERDHYSQRQIDIIKNEIMPKYSFDAEETGIITPYKNQVRALKSEIDNIDSATVHKFQGREKDNIIISTVDDEISDFADDPYLINVAVSRAKKRLMLVVTGNKQVRERNITDLIDYIQYNNFEVVDSKINSVFDYLYRQYTRERKAYLQRHKKISEYDSENLMYSLIKDIISDNKYSKFDVVCHFPLNMLIKNTELLNEQERRYVLHPATHIDFLIYNRIGKKAVLAIEVDGYEFHNTDTAQASRDLLKNHILELYEIPLLRFKTNGSGEKKIIIEMLDKLIGNI